MSELKEYLAARGMSQAALARELGVTQGAVGHWLRGASAITAERAIQIEAVTGIPRSTLRPDIFPAGVAV
jgi:DNA-binding transcriptional regulator YdaS (Cro superfamily)